MKFKRVLNKPSLDSSIVPDEGSLSSVQISSLSRSVGKPSVSKDTNRPIFKRILLKNLKKVNTKETEPNLKKFSFTPSKVGTTRSTSAHQSLTIKFSFSPRPPQPSEGDHNSEIDTIITEFQPSKRGTLFKNSRVSKNSQESRRSSRRFTKHSNTMGESQISQKRFKLNNIDFGPDLKEPLSEPKNNAHKRFEAISRKKTPPSLLRIDSNPPEDQENPLQNFKKSGFIRAEKDRTQTATAADFTSFKRAKTIKKNRASMMGFEEVKKRLMNKFSADQKKYIPNMAAINSVNLISCDMDSSCLGRDLYELTNEVTLDQQAIPTIADLKKKSVLKDSVLSIGSSKSIKKVSFGGATEVFEVPHKDESRRNLIIPPKVADLRAKPGGMRARSSSRFASRVSQNFCPIGSMIAKENNIKADLQNSLNMIYGPKAD